MQKIKMSRGTLLTFEESCNMYLENCRQRNSWRKAVCFPASVETKRSFAMLCVFVSLFFCAFYLPELCIFDFVCKKCRNLKTPIDNYFKIRYYNDRTILFNFSCGGKQV